MQRMLVVALPERLNATNVRPYLLGGHSPITVSMQCRDTYPPFYEELHTVEHQPFYH